MDDWTLIGLITVPGLALIFSAFDALARRIGKFKPIPGERRRRFRSLAVVLALGVVLPFAIPVIGSSFQTLTIVLSVALIAYLLLTRNRRAKALAALTPEEREELDRRVAFARSARGIALISASLAAAVLWSIGAVVLVSTLTG